MESRSIALSFHVRRFVLALLCTGMVLVLTHIPQEAIPNALAIGGFDKLIHAALYAAITLSFLSAIERHVNYRMLVILVLGIVALAATDEWTQPLVNRTACGRRTHLLIYASTSEVEGSDESSANPLAWRWRTLYDGMSVGSVF